MGIISKNTPIYVQSQIDYIDYNHDNKNYFEIDSEGIETIFTIATLDENQQYNIKTFNYDIFCLKEFKQCSKSSTGVVISIDIINLKPNDKTLKYCLSGNEVAYNCDLINESVTFSNLFNVQSKYIRDDQLLNVLIFDLNHMICFRLKLLNFSLMEAFTTSFYLKPKTLRYFPIHNYLM